MGELKIEESELELVALLLRTINPGRSSPNHIRDMIRANIRPGDNTVMSTGGWVAGTYIDSEGNTVVRVSLAAYSVARYMEMQGSMQ